MTQETKSILILKATKDICGDELGLITSHCQLLGMTVVEETIACEATLLSALKAQKAAGGEFHYVYLCTHGDTACFVANTGSKAVDIEWRQLAMALCEHGTMHDDGIVLLACCKGGFFQVAADIFACCNKVNFVCGVKWNVAPWDLTTGFVVFIHNMEVKRAEPAYAAKKASLATDYTFACYDRDEAEMQPSYQQRRFDLFLKNGWINEQGQWITDDATITENADKKNLPRS